MNSCTSDKWAEKSTIRVKVACALMEIDLEQCEEWVSMAPSSADQRREDLMRIARALAILLPKKGEPAAWLRAPNTDKLFKNQSALELIAEEPEALEMVRSYLEAQIYRETYLLTFSD